MAELLNAAVLSDNKSTDAVSIFVDWWTDSDGVRRSVLAVTCGRVSNLSLLADTADVGCIKVDMPLPDDPRNWDDSLIVLGDGLSGESDPLSVIHDAWEQLSRWMDERFGEAN